MTIRFTKQSSENTIKLTTKSVFGNWDPKKDKDKPIFSFNSGSTGQISLGKVQEKLLFALAGGHNCEGCGDPDDLFTLTERDLKEANQRFKNGDYYLFGDVKVKEFRYDEKAGVANITTQKGEVLRVDLLTEAEKKDDVDSTKNISQTSQRSVSTATKPATKPTTTISTPNKKSKIANNKTSSRKKDVKNFLIALANRESSGKHAIMNKAGYVGLYQVGEEALADVGVYYETKNVNYKKNDWSGYIKGGNKYGISCLWDFMHSPDKQKAVQIDFKKKHWQYLENLNLTQYVGKTIKGIYITQSGLLAGAHLVGPGGVRDFLRSHGKNDVKDANGTPVSSYIKKFGGYDIKEITS